MHTITLFKFSFIRPVLVVNYDTASDVSCLLRISSIFAASFKPSGTRSQSIDKVVNVKT